MVQEYIGRKFRTSAICLICMAAALGLWIFVLLEGFNWEITVFMSLFTLSMIGWVSLAIVMIACDYIQLRRNAGWIQNRNMQHIADDIHMDEFTFPRAKIYCGKHAFLSCKSKVLIPYASVCWAYMKLHTSMGMTTDSKLMIHTRDGQKFTVAIGDQEARQLISRFVAPNSPGAILGYGAEQKRRYKAMRMR